MHSDLVSVVNNVSFRTTNQPYIRNENEGNVLLLLFILVSPHNQIKIQYIILIYYFIVLRILYENSREIKDEGTFSSNYNPVSSFIPSCLLLNRFNVSEVRLKCLNMSVIFHLNLKVIPISKHQPRLVQKMSMKQLLTDTSEIFGQNPCPRAICLPQIPHGVR
jgi:hypothetical protein